MKSMRTSINRFLARATGPMRLRSELSQKTKPMSALLGKIDVASTVRAEVPQSILGGDILALMSEQLRQAIQYSGQDESATDDTPKSQFRLEPQPGSIAGRAEAGTSPQPLPAKRSADPFPELRSESRKQEMGFPTPASDVASAERELSAAPRPTKRSADLSPELRSESRKQETGFPTPSPDVASAEGWPSALPGDVKTTRPALETEKAAQSDQQPSTFENWESAEKNATAEQADANTFVEKLQEYRQLTQQERASESAPGFSDSPGKRDRKTAAPFPESTHRAVPETSWSGLERDAAPGRAEPAPGFSDSPGEQYRKTAAPFSESTPRAVPETSWSGLESDAAPGRATPLSSTGKTDSVEGSESQNIAPVLVEKLREYWRLSRPENSPEKISAYPGSPITDGGNADASFPALPRYTPAPGSWPEMTGQQAAKNIDSFISGRGTPGSVRSVRQVIQSDLPEKVEIQNVFNIQVKNEESRENSRDLSEKIADILHEQALQHGIDVT